MFENKSLSEVTEQDIIAFRTTRGRTKDTNRRMNKGGVLDILIAGAKKIPALSTTDSDEEKVHDFK